MATRNRAAGKKSRPKNSGKSAAKSIAATRKLAPVSKKLATLKKPAPKIVAKKPVAPPKPVAKSAAIPTAVAARPVAPPPRPQAAIPPQAAKPAGAPPPKPAAARPSGQTDAAARLASAQQAEERRKAATRKLFARLRSLEAIVGADLRKRGSLLLSQAVDQWYAEAISASASDVTITNAARAVIAQL
jgi:hypothetical protein